MFIDGILILFGIVVGVIGAAWLRKEEVATEADLNNWRSRLDTAVNSDMTIAKREVASVVSEIRMKLHPSLRPSATAPTQKL
jgi:hypothetical protein